MTSRSGAGRYRSLYGSIARRFPDRHLSALATVRREADTGRLRVIVLFALGERDRGPARARSSPDVRTQCGDGLTLALEILGDVLSITRIDESFGFLGEATADGPSDVPHSSQNFVPGLFLELHFGHEASMGAAHSLQNLAPSRFSAPHFEQRMLSAQLVEQRLGLFQVGGVESLGEPVVDFREHHARFVAAIVVAQQSRETRCRA